MIGFFLIAKAFKEKWHWAVVVDLLVVPTLVTLEIGSSNPVFRKLYLLSNVLNLSLCMWKFIHHGAI